MEIKQLFVFPYNTHFLTTNSTNYTNELRMPVFENIKLKFFLFALLVLFVV
jgi:hypothetical protein